MAGVKLFRGVVVFSLAGVFLSYQFMMQGAPAFMVPELVASLDLNLVEVSWLTSSFLYIYLLFQVPGGIVADHLPSRFLLCAACVLMGFCCYWFSVAQGYHEALLARGLMGVATSPGIVICMTLVGRWFPRHWFPVMSGLVEFFAVVGGAIGPLLIPCLMEYSGWRGSMWGVAVFGWGLALLVLFLVREGPSSEKQPTAESTVPKNQGYNWSALFKAKDFWLSALYGFGMFAFLGYFGGLWGVPFLNGRFPGEEVIVRESMSLIYIGAAIGTPGLGALATVIGHYRRIMVCSAILVILLSALALYSNCSLSGVCCLCFLIGLCCGGYMLAFTTVRNVAPSSMVGVALAAVNGCILLGGPLLQPLTGKILSLQGATLAELSSGDYRVAFISLTICQVVALLAALSLSPVVEKTAD